MIPTPAIPGIGVVVRRAMHQNTLKSIGDAGVRRRGHICDRAQSGVGIAGVDVIEADFAGEGKVAGCSEEGDGGVGVVVRVAAFQRFIDLLLEKQESAGGYACGGANLRGQYLVLPVIMGPWQAYLSRGVTLGSYGASKSQKGRPSSGK